MVTCSKIYESLTKYQKDNYYLVDAQGNAMHPQKIGSGWEKMGAGDLPVTEEVYSALKEGRDPTSLFFSNLQFSSAPSASSAVELFSPLVQDGVNGKHRGGYDITISYHKSWSVWANSSPENRQLFQEIRSEVSANVTAYFEKELAQCRYGHDGIVEPIKTCNVIGLKVEHGLSREGDVQEHDHHAFFNMTQNPETGKWQALQSDAFKNDAIERIAENEIANIAQRKGLSVEWVKSDSGKSEYCSLAGVPGKAIEVNSTGAQRVDRYVEEHRDELRSKYPNASEGELKQYAEILTRPDKVSMTEAEKQERFETNLASGGLTKADINKGVEQARELQRGSARDPRSAGDIVRQAYKSQQDYESVFSRTDLLKSAAALSRGEYSISEIEKAIKGLDSEVLKIEDKHVFDNGRREYADTAYTTRDVLQAEQRFEGRVVNGQGAVTPLMTPEAAAEAIKAHEALIKADKPDFRITDSQRGALAFLLTNDDRYKAIQGYAGTGKTSALSTYQAILKEQGYIIIGISESNTAVNEMKATRIENAYTTTRFLHDKKLQDQIGPKTIILSDETSFTGSLNADKVTEIVEAKGARADFWGDKDQLPPISAGHPFHHVVTEKKINSYEMTDIVRQKDGQYRDAVYDIIKRDIDSAFNKLEVHEIGIKEVLEANPNLKDKYEKEVKGQGMDSAAAPQLPKELHATISVKQQEMINQKIAEIYKEHDGYHNFVVPVTTNCERHELNGILRSQNIEAGKVSEYGEQRQVYVNKNLTGIERFTTSMYRAGDKLIAQEGKAGISVGKEGIVQEVDVNRGVLKVEVGYKAGPEIREIDILQNGDKFLSFERRTIEVAPGEKIIFNRTDKDSGIANSDIAYVQFVNRDGSLFLDYKGKEVEYKGEHYEHGYAWTGQRVQGKTAHGTLPVDPRNFQSFYVGETRGEYKAAIVTPDIERLKENVTQYVEKEHTYKYRDQINTEINRAQRELGQVIARLDKEPDELRQAEYRERAMQLQTKLNAYQDFRHDISRETEQPDSPDSTADPRNLAFASGYTQTAEVYTPSIEQSLSDIRELAGSDRGHDIELENAQVDIREPEPEKELELG